MWSFPSICRSVSPFPRVACFSLSRAAFSRSAARLAIADKLFPARPTNSRTARWGFGVSRAGSFPRGRRLEIGEAEVGDLDRVVPRVGRVTCGAARAPSDHAHTHGALPLTWPGDEEPR